MASWPCQNPSCKSHGEPHPNCQCLAPMMAEGGAIEHYCSADRKHSSDCQYFVDGGEVLPPFEETQPVAAPSQQPKASSQDLPAFEDTKEVPQLPAFEDTKPVINATTPMQQGLAAVEGGAQGFLGPLATLAEKGLNKAGLPGFSNEEINARAEQNPEIHGIAQAAGLGAGLLTGTGEAGLIANLTPELEAASVLAKAGSAYVKGAIGAGLFQTGDEISNAMLGKGNPEAPLSSALAHIKTAMLIGGGTAGLFNIIGQSGTKGLQAIENSKMGERAKNIIAGIGLASKMKEMGVPIEKAEELAGDVYKDIKPGIDIFNRGFKEKARGVAQAVGATVGGGVAGPYGAYAGSKLADHILTPAVEKIIDKGISKGNEYVFPAVLRCISEGNTKGLAQAIDYATKVSKGANTINMAVNGLFNVNKSHHLINFKSSSEDRDKLNQIIEDGGVNSQIQNQMNDDQQPQGYAEGGKVKHKVPKDPQVSQEPDHFATAFPEQAMGLSAAKGRIYKYLNSQRPQAPVGKLPYEEHRPNAEQHRTYNRALDIANEPLSVLNRIKDGTLSVEHVSHLNQMHPELYRHLSQKITERIMHNQIDDQKPSYKMRQALSIFLAAPMDKSFTPSNIQAAQQVFAAKRPMQQPQQDQPQGKTKRGTSTLGKNNKSYKTASQAAESDRTSRD